MRTSRNKRYWAERSVELEAHTQTEVGKAADKIRRAYERAVENINKDIEDTFQEFSRFTGVDKKLARELIDNAKNDAQYEELLFLLEEVTDEAQQEEIKKRINAQAYGARMNRLEALKQRAYIELKKAASIEQMIHNALHSQIMEISYYTTIVDVAKGLNCGIDFSLLGEKAIEKVLESDWLGSNYSSRIWKNNKQFVGSVQETIEDGIIAGHSVDRMAESLKDFVNAEDGRSARYVTERLVRTEAAHFMAEGQAAAYDEVGAQTYQFVASLSERTCEECGALDGETFKLSERAPGLNYPVIHPNCRCTTIIGDFLPRTRTAHDPLDGHKYKVDGSVTYEQWKNGLSDEQRTAMELHVKQMRNASSDREQYERYKSVLGAENIPKTFDKFVELKYNDSAKYSELKRLYSENHNYLQEQLAYLLPSGEKNFIPDKTIISTVKTIAGAGSKTELKVESALIKNYGGSEGNWKKRVGKIESSKYIFDVHWYELNGKQYRMKLKNRSYKK